MKANKEISENSILDFHLAHRTNPEFTFEPNKDTPKANLEVFIIF
jgi:hypothetical protein